MSQYTSKNLPLRHLSIRVPWHDNGWNGCVCQKPRENTACLALDRIKEDKDDEREAPFANKPFSDLSDENRPVCIAERAFFMAPNDTIRTMKHAYLETSELHKHLLPTKLRVPSYSAACVPFRWMLKKNAWEIAKEFNLTCSEENEPKLEFNTSWVQDYHNQQELLETFFGMIKPEKSLCFFYAKQVPFVEDEGRRILIGVGRVKHISRPVEFERSNEDGLRGVIWDVPVQHSIRPDYRDGFLLPYQKLFKKVEANPDINPGDYLASIPARKCVFMQYCHGDFSFLRP